MQLLIIKKCVSKLHHKRDLSPLFQDTGFRDFYLDYGTLNVAVDPNVSSRVSELIKTHNAIDVRNAYDNT